MGTVVSARVRAGGGHESPLRLLGEDGNHHHRVGGRVEEKETVTLGHQPPTPAGACARGFLFLTSAQVP